MTNEVRNFLVRIALNIEHFDINRGGAERYVYDLAKEMVKEGHDVHVFYRTGRPSAGSGMTLHTVPAGIFPAISFIINSSREIKKIPFDIVHVFGKNTYMNIFQPLGGSHRGSFIQNLRSIDNPLLKGVRFLGALINLKKLMFFYAERVQMKNKDKLRIIAISEMVKDMFIKYYGVPEVNIDVVYNGVDLNKFNPRNKAVYRESIRKKWGLDDELVLIFIANNFRLKGLHCAIKTIADLKRKEGPGYFKLLVVGGGKRKRFLRLAKQLDCTEDIVFVGSQDSVERYFGASDICFQPTFYDPASLVVLESLASGVPVITTKYSGMGEIITNGSEGFIVDNPRDIEGLSSKIMFFKKGPNLNRCSKAARRLAEKFPLEKNYEKVLEVYKKVISGTGASEARVRILFLTSRTNNPSFRFRVLQYIRYLEENGWSIVTQEIPKNWFKQMVWLSRLNNFDVIFIQRRLLRALQLRRLKNKTTSLCYDFDDAIMYKDSSKGAVPSKRREQRFRLMMQKADMVIAGNQYLASKAGEFCRAVEVIPTVVDTDRYFHIDNRGKKEEVILGWMGTRSTLVYLDGISDILKKVLGEFKNTRLKVVCDSFSGFNVPGAIMKKWKIQDEISDLQSFDIGLMPLSDDDWARGKCGFKLIQYMAVGIPVICSSIGVNNKIVAHRVNGFLAESSESWIEYLSQLIEDVGLRNRMGLAGRDFIKKNYNLDYWGRYMGKLLNNLLGEGR